MIKMNELLSTTGLLLYVTQLTIVKTIPTLLAITLASHSVTAYQESLPCFEMISVEYKHMQLHQSMHMQVIGAKEGLQETGLGV